MTQIILRVRAINALAVSMAIVLETTPPRLLNAGKHLCTIWSKLSNSKGLPRGKGTSSFFGSRLSFFAFLISSLRRALNLRAELSFSDLFVANLFAAADAPWTAAYFPIWKRSLSDHRQYDFLFYELVESAIACTKAWYSNITRQDSGWKCDGFEDGGCAKIW